MSTVDRTLDNYELRVCSEITMYRDETDKSEVVKIIPPNAEIKIWNYDLRYYYEISYEDPRQGRQYQGYVSKRQLNPIARYVDLERDERIAM